MSLIQISHDKKSYLKSNLFLKHSSLLFLFFTFLVFGQLNAQVGINDNGDPPDVSAGLDVDFSNKGFLPPRLTIAQRDAITTPAAGLFIFNTDENCLQFYDGSKWSSLAIVPTNDLICNTVSVFGDYLIGSALTAGEYISIDVDVNVLGAYNITTDVVNGYSFSATGTFTVTGVQEVLLQGSGTPLSSQLDSFVISVDGNAEVCNTDISVAYYKQSCLALLNDGYTTDGTYTIDPDGQAGIDAFDCYCDMTTDGGGWTQISYAADLPHQSHFSSPDSPRWLDSDFSLSLTDAQINAIRNISTEGKQDLTITCYSVIVYANSVPAYTYAFGYRYHTGFETASGQQTYPNTNISINTDGCMSNDNVMRNTTLSISDTRLPVTNFFSRDNGTGESFGSPLTAEPAWLR